MKNSILLCLFLFLPTISLAATYSGSVTRESPNLYRMEPQDKYVKTVNCSVTTPEDAVLTLETASGQISFTTSETTCDVIEAYDSFAVALNNSLVNVSLDTQDWYSLNTYNQEGLIIVDDNGKRVKTTNCSENVNQEFAYITTNADGIGSLDFGGQTFCNVSGIYDRIFEATDTWVVHNIDANGAIDWLATEHEPLTHASYVRINGQYFYIYNSSTDSPLPGGGVSYNDANLLTCNQLTGEPGPGPFDPDGPQWADLSGIIGEEIEAFASWQSISDLEISIDLRQGWNLISIPLDRDWALLDALESIAGQYELVRGFNEEGEIIYDPSLSDELNTLNSFSRSHGYWIKMNSPGTLTLTGRALSASYSLLLHTGWNLIGHWGGDEKQVALSEGTSTYVAETAISDDLFSIVDSIELVRSFDVEGAKTFDPNIPEHLNTLHSLGVGQGYWIKLNQDAILNFVP